MIVLSSSNSSMKLGSSVFAFLTCVRSRFQSSGAMYKNGLWSNLEYFGMLISYLQLDLILYLIDFFSWFTLLCR